MDEKLTPEMQEALNQMMAARKSLNAEELTGVFHYPEGDKVLKNTPKHSDFLEIK